MDGHTTKKLNVLYICADEDYQALEALDKHLKVLERRGWIQSWHEGKLSAGMERAPAVEKHFKDAHIILLFISSDFLASDRCYSQMEAALDKHKNKQARVIPLLIRSSDWQNTPLGKLRVLPENNTPVMSGKNLDDEALYNAANSIQMVVKTLLKGVYLATVPVESSFVLRLQRDIENQGIIVWSTPKEQNIDREKAIQQMVRASHLVVLIASPSTKHARSIKEELHIARMYQKRIVPLWVAGNIWQESTPSSLAQSSYIDGRIPEGYRNTLERIVTLYHKVEALHDSVEIDPDIPPLPHSAPPFEPRNPYKALRAFTSSDEDDFFGREKLTSELVDAVREILMIKNKAQSERFLAVIGPSGVGKSSVVMAGLLPRLQEGILLGSENWIYLTPMVPGALPIESLALVLAHERVREPVKTIYDDLVAKGERGLYWQAFELVKAKPPGTKIVLVVDQFEELFTHPSEQERQHFIDLLVTAATEPQSPVVVIVTLRADFYDRPMNYSELSKLIESHSKLVPVMNIDELRTVIKKPAALHDVQLSFEPDLVGDLLFEMHGQPGALPLLEFTLDQLFQRRRSRQLTRQAYEEIGGVNGALSKHAEETYAALPSDEHRQLTRALFLRLIELGVTEQNMTRHRATLSELTLPDPKQTAIIRQVADAFVHARLLTTNKVGETMTIEVSHEAVIREWERLSEWVREARQDIPLQNAISKDVVEWKQHGKPRDRLYRGSQLKDAQEWATRNFPSSNEITFLQASAAQRTLTLVSLIVVVLLLVSSIAIAGRIYLTQPPNPTLVTTTQDSMNGSLRYCIDNAPSGSTITFAQSVRGTITLTGGGLAFPGGKQLTLAGPGANQLTISGSNLDAIIHVSKGAKLNISGLSFKNSETVLSAFLFNEGTLTVTNSIISNNKTTAGGASFGGGFGNNGTSLGGGILNSSTGTLIVIDSTISNNSAITNNSSSSNQNGQGGGIYNDGKLTVIHSTFSNNSASSNGQGLGGGIDNHGLLTVISSTFSNNKAIGSSSSGQGLGGGIFNHSAGTVTVTNSTFSGNSASGIQNGWGGGIQNDGKLTVISSTFSNNSATSSASGSDSFSLGGGIYIYAGTVTVTNSTFSSNSAGGKQDGQGGGIADDGTLTLTNSTISNNTAMSDGGGISIYGAQADLIFCTIYGNTITGTGGGLSMRDAQDNNGNKIPSQVRISESIVAGNRAVTAPDIWGAFTSYGYNLIQNIDGATINNGSNGKSDIIDSLPDIGPLQNKGNLTPTHALLPGSPAIDKVPLQYCQIKDIYNSQSRMYTDQRNDQRPDGSEKTCDIGAYESSY